MREVAEVHARVWITRQLRKINPCKLLKRFGQVAMFQSIRLEASKMRAVLRSQFAFEPIELRLVIKREHHQERSALLDFDSAWRVFLMR